MNCARCGAQLQPGANRCSVCGEAAGAPGVYQQSYVQYQQGSYPPGYQAPYAYGQTPSHDEGGFLGALSDLPHAFVESFTHPGDVMRTMVERRDRFSWIIVTALCLLLSFLCGMVLMRGFLGLLLRAISALSGTPLASTDASMSQGVSYIAGRVAPMAGGIAALCQLISMLVPAAVFMVYICGVCRVAFSWELLTSFVAVISLNTVAVSVLAMAGSLLTPWLAIGLILCGMAVSYVQATGMLGLITARPDQQLMFGKLLCVVISLALTLLLCGVIGGLLMGGVVDRVLILLNNVGALI